MGTQSAQRKRSVLVVEDHPDTLRLMAKLLTGHGYLVTTARGVEDALSKSQGNSFDFLVSDLGLPDGTGYDILARMEIPPRHSIALTGYSFPEEAGFSPPKEFDKRLVKPIDVQKLFNALISSPKSTAEYPSRTEGNTPCTAC